MTVVGRVGADVQDGKRLTNTATVFSPSDVVSTSNNAESAGVLVNRAVKLTVTKSSTPSPTVPGGGLTYVIVVSNAGPSDAAFVTMTDNLPDGFAVISVNGTLGGVCNSSDPVECSWATLPAGQSATVTIVGSVAASQTAALTNTAQVTTTTAITGNSQLSATITTPVSPTADLALAVGSTPTVFGGESLVVTPTVVNNGPSYAQNTVVTVTLAPSTTFNPGATVLPSGWYSQLLSGGIVVITTSVPLTPDTPIDLPIVVDVAAGVLPGTSLQFNGTTSSTTSDPDTTNNTANADTSVVRKATLKIAKTSDPATVTAGELVTYTITITNEGPSDARFVDVKEQLPSGLTLQSIAASDGGACAGTLCQFGTITQHATRTISVVARVGSDVTGVVTNTAAVDSVDNATGLPVSTTATTTITTRAVLTMTKTALNEPVQAGGVALYEIVVRNLGPSDAQDVVVTDTLPVSTTYAGGDAACVANGGEIVCTIGMLAAGAIRTLLVQVNVSQHIVAGTVITNAAVAGSPTAPLTTTATATNTVAQPADGVADVQINKDGPATVTAGERITYTLVVTNRGPASAQDVQVVDALPVGVSYVSATATQGTCAGAVNCQLGDLALNATATVTIVGLVDSAVVSGTLLINLAQVNSANEDPLSANNTATATTTVEQLSNISMSKYAVPATATAGSALVYQIVVTNAGPSVASGVVVSDVLPAGFVLSSVSSSQGSCTSLPCPVGDIAAGATVVVTIRGAVESSQTSDLANSASLTATTPLTGTTGTTLTTPVSTTADLALVLNSTPTAVGGETAIVTATVTNAGPSDAAGTVVTITLPPGTSYTTATLPGGWCGGQRRGTVTLTTTMLHGEGPRW